MRKRKKRGVTLADPATLTAEERTAELGSLYSIISQERYNHSNEEMLVDLLLILEKLPDYEGERHASPSLSGIYVKDITQRIRKILWWNEHAVPAARTRIKVARTNAADTEINTLDNLSPDEQNEKIHKLPDYLLRNVTLSLCNEEIREAVLFELETRAETFSSLESLLNPALEAMQQREGISKRLREAIAQELTRRIEHSKAMSNYSTYSARTSNGARQLPCPVDEKYLPR